MSVMAAILLSAVTELYILPHIFGTKHDGVEKVMYNPMFLWSSIRGIPYTTS